MEKRRKVVSLPLRLAKLERWGWYYLDGKAKSRFKPKDAKWVLENVYEELVDASNYVDACAEESEFLKWVGAEVERLAEEVRQEYERLSR